MHDHLLLILSAISFGLGTVGVPASVNWVALGLLLWVLTTLV
jgi:hypothetical protein